MEYSCNFMVGDWDFNQHRCVCVCVCVCVENIITQLWVCCVVSLTTQKPFSQNVCSDLCLCEDWAFGGRNSRAECIQ